MIALRRGVNCFVFSPSLGPSGSVGFLCGSAGMANCEGFAVACPLSFTVSGRPVFLTGEVEVEAADDVSLYDSKDKALPGLQSGSVSLTNLRLLWKSSDSPPTGLAIPLSSVVTASKKSSGLFSFQRSKLSILMEKDTEEGLLVEEFLLKFHGRGRDSLLEAIQNVLTRKPWLRVISEAPCTKNGGEGGSPSSSSPSDPSSSEASSVPTFMPTRAGIGGVFRRAQDKENAVTRSLAFTDLEGLMENAASLVRFLDRQLPVLAAAGGEMSSSAENSSVRTLMSELGLTNAVSKRLSGTKFHTELARELADFLGPLLQEAGGVLTLTDVYCMYNRARGVDLISPDDLRCSCSLFSQLHLPLRLREFDSGVIVVQSESLNDASIHQEMMDLLGGALAGAGLSPHSWSLHKKCGLVLATQQLVNAEEAEVLCRDETLEGLWFYPNLFLTNSGGDVLVQQQ